MAELIGASQLQHGDETGIRVYGMLHWLHVNCTRFLTHLAWHASRGREAIDEIGIWPSGTSLGESSAKDFWHLSQSDGGLDYVKWLLNYFPIIF